MTPQRDYKKYLPHVLILAIFIVISILFCYPAIQGNTINQHDIFNWLYGSKEGRDFFQQTGQNALWTNHVFGGMPSVISDFQPITNWFHKLNSIVQLYDNGTPANPFIYFFLAMVSFYILMSVMKVNRWIGALGAIAFAFSSYNPIIISAGHITKMLDIAFLPGVMAGVLLAYRGKIWQGAALMGLFLALFIDSGHFQIIYYGAMLLVIMIIGKLVIAIKKNQTKTWFFASGALALAAIFALTANASKLIQTQEYSKYSTRGGVSELTTPQELKSKGLDRDYAFAWSNGIGESFCVLVPNLYGGTSSENIGTDSHLGEKLASLNVPPQTIEQVTSSVPLYWGPQSFTSPIYFGAVICFLFILSLFVIKSTFKWWIVGAAFLFFCLSVGNHFSTLNYFLFDHFPLMSKFRAPSMALTIPSILFPLLGMWALKDIFLENITKEELLKKLKLSILIAGGICVLILIGSVTMMDFKGNNDAQIEQQYAQAFNNPQIGKELLTSIREDRASATQKDALRSLVFVLLAGGVLWGFGKGKIKKEMVIASLGLFIILDELPIAHRYLNENNFIDDYSYEQQFEPRPVDAQILKDPDPYFRVLDLSNTGAGDFNPFNSAKPSYFFKSIGGYSAAKLEIYKELIDDQLSNFNIAVLNMLNMKYLIAPSQKGEPMLQPNPIALGNAWFVSNIKWAKTADEAMTDLNAPSLKAPQDTSKGNFNPSATAILRDSLKPQFQSFTFGKDSTASIKLTHYAPNKLSYESNNSQAGLAVFSDIYYPLGWKATIDGKEAHIYRTDFVLRALQVPAGKHNIEFVFAPTSYQFGENVGLIGSILLSLLILLGIYIAFKNSKSDEDESNHDANNKQALNQAAKKK